MVIAWIQTLVFVSILAVDTRARFVQGLSVSGHQFKLSVDDTVLTNRIGVWDTNWDRCFRHWLRVVLGQSTPPSIQQWCRRLYHQLVLDQANMVAMQTQSARVCGAIQHNRWAALEIMDYFLILNTLPLPALNQFYSRISNGLTDAMVVEWDGDVCALSAIFSPAAEGEMIAMQKNSIFYQYFIKHHGRYPTVWDQCVRTLQLIALDSLYQSSILKQLTQTADALVKPRLAIVDRCVRQLAAIQAQ